MADRLRYYTSAADTLDTSAVERDPSSAIPKNVKSGSLYKDSETLDIKIGTMPIIQAADIKINPKTKYSTDFSYTIPEGYHDGNGKVYTGNLSEYTPGTATPEDVIKNKVFWVNGERLAGTIDPDYIDTRGTATAEDIAEGETAWVNKEKITGTVPRLPKRDKILSAGESYTFPYGISDGTSEISAKSLESQTVATATENDIILGKTAWANGEKLNGAFNINQKIKELFSNTNAIQSHVLEGELFYSATYNQVVSGRMVDHSGEEDKIIDPGQRVVIPEGYYNGQTYAKVHPLEDLTAGTAKAENILNNKTAWVNGEKVTGTMPFITPVSEELPSGATYIIPKGYHTGEAVLTTKDISEETPGTATDNDILLDKTAWVYGEKVTGTIPTRTVKIIRITAGNDVTIPAGFYPDGVIIYALVPDVLDLTGTNAWYEREYCALHPEDAGYVDEENEILVITAESL